MDRHGIRRRAARILRWLIAVGFYVTALVFTTGLIGADPATTVAPVAETQAQAAGQESPLMTLSIAAAAIAALGTWQLVRLVPRRRPVPAPRREPAPRAARPRQVIVPR